MTTKASPRYLLSSLNLHRRLLISRICEGILCISYKPNTVQVYIFMSNVWMKVLRLSLAGIPSELNDEDSKFVPLNANANDSTNDTYLFHFQRNIFLNHVSSCNCYKIFSSSVQATKVRGHWWKNLGSLYTDLRTPCVTNTYFLTKIKRVNKQIYFYLTVNSHV